MFPALLTLLAAVVLAGPPTEKELRADAQKWVAALCAEHKDKCSEASAVLKDYAALLPDTAKCESGPCDRARIIELSKAVGKIDDRAMELPPTKDPRPPALLRLGALASLRLAAAAARIKDEMAALTMSRDETEAVRAAEQVCLVKPGADCANGRAAIAEAKALRPQIEPCVKADCAFAKVDSLAQASRAAVDKSLFPAVPNVRAYEIFAFALTTQELATAALSRFVDRTLARLNADAGAFEKQVEAAEKDSLADARALPGKAETLSKAYEEATLAADRLSDILGYEKTGAKREEVNSATRRLGALRSRAFAAITARGFGNQAIDNALAAVGVAPPQQPGKLKPGVVLSQTTPTLLDKRAIPAPSGAFTSVKPIIAGDKSVFRAAIDVNSDDPMVSADAKRRLGFTNTIGNPGRYAGFAYHQAAHDTCAVAAQIQILRAHGYLPTNEKPEDQENRLTPALKAKGYLNEGTAAPFVGELLVERGMLVQKHEKAEYKDLVAAVRRGGLLEVTVDARYIWGEPATTGSPKAHAILVTGAEVEKVTGRMLGVYINDSGDWPAQGGRFITMDLLSKAYYNSFVEIH